MSGNVVMLCRRQYGLKTPLRQWHHHTVRGMRGVRFEQCEEDACVMGLAEAAGVSIIVVVVVVVHVDDMFAMGFKSRRGKCF